MTGKSSSIEPKLLAARLEDFGPLADSETGLVVLAASVKVFNSVTGSIFQTEPVTGIIRGHSKDGVVIQLDENKFLGRLARDQYRVLNLVTPDIKTIH